MNNPANPSTTSAWGVTRHLGLKLGLLGLFSGLVLSLVWDSCWHPAKARQDRALARVLQHECTSSGAEGVEIPQSFWRLHDVYLVECSGGESFAVATNAAWAYFELSAQAAFVGQSDSGVRTAEMVTRNFNQISLVEGVVVNDKNVHQYVTFFARLFNNTSSVYFPDEMSVHELLETEQQTAAGNRLGRRLGRWPIFVSIVEVNGRFEATAYTAELHLGAVYRLDVLVRRNGVVDASYSYFGTQGGEPFLDLAPEAPD